MEFVSGSNKDSSVFWVFGLPAILGFETLVLHLLLYVLLAIISSSLFTWALFPWSRLGKVPIPGPRGLPVFGSLFTLSGHTPHHTLASLATTHAATQLMAVSVGSTRTVITSDPSIAREILHHPSFSDRPTTLARELMFSRAIGFAPSGAYWRLLRRIASTYLFSPSRIAAHEPGRKSDCTGMMNAILAEQRAVGSVVLRPHLQAAALNNIMGSVFGRRYDVLQRDVEAAELVEMVEEGFELLGAFNWSDHLQWLAGIYDPLRVKDRCAALIPRVRSLVKGFIEEHKRRDATVRSDGGDFLDVLMSLTGDEKLEEEDLIAVLWEMIFRGTDTTALLTEWTLAELVRHPNIQSRLHAELATIVNPTDPTITAKVASLPYLTAVVKETLRIHPPGPLLSWSRISTADVQLTNDMVIPAGTTAMVNMWAIAHDKDLWACPEEFLPERFMVAEGGEDVDVRGGDLRLAPFGAGRRVCPGKNMGMTAVVMWVAKLVWEFEWVTAEGEEVVMDEVLKLSCEMKTPLKVVALKRENATALF